MINTLEVEISDDPITGLKRKLIHQKFEIGPDLQMTHYRKIRFYEKMTDGSYGRPINQVISEDVNLTQEAKNKLYQLYEDQYYHVTTVDSIVDPATGQPVTKDSDGNYPVGSIQELDFWQTLPISYIQPTPNTNADVVYGLLKMSMKSSDNNGRV